MYFHRSIDLTIQTDLVDRSDRWLLKKVGSFCLSDLDGQRD